jgi:hypothetical protein
MTTIVNDVSDVGIYNIVSDQGTTFIRSITYKNSAGVAVNLGTGASAHMKVRKSYPATSRVAAYRADPVLNISSNTTTYPGSTLAITVTAATGVIAIAIPSGTMAAAAAGIYDYDLEVTLGTSPGIGTVGDVIKVIRGLFEIRQEITY